MPDKKEVLEVLHMNRKLNHKTSSNTMYKNEKWLHPFQCTIKKAYYSAKYTSGFPKNILEICSGTSCMDSLDSALSV